MESEQDPEEQLPPAPAVVAVVVTCDAGDWFDDVLAALAAQDYPNLSVLVIDDASAVDPTPRVAAVLPAAFIRRLPERVGWSTAANEVLALVEGASHFAFLHDDAAPDPDAIRLMVEEAFRSNAGVVAPKLVMWDEPERLLQVGESVDKSGAPAALAERGELDQAQHDAVRDVFVAPGGCTVVRADLFSAIGGYDAAIGMLGDDVDLSWRAQIAGARVVVAPAARVRHVEAITTGRRAGQPDPDDLRPVRVRNRLRTVLTAYSGFHLLRVIPQIALLAIAEVVYGVITRRSRTSKAVVHAWSANLRDLQGIRARRRVVQSVRALPDREVRRFQARGSARFTAFVRGQLAASGRPAAAAVATRGFNAMLRDPSVRLQLGVWSALLLVLAIGSRHLIGQRIPAVGQLLPFPEHATTLARSYLTGWRLAGLGSDGPAPAAFAVLSLLGYALAGAMGLLQKVLILGTLPLGIVGAYWAARDVGRGRARLAAAVAYAVMPVWYDALARGRWDGLLLYAAAPWFLGVVLRSGALAPFDLRPGVDRRLLPVGIALAVLCALVPAAALVVFVGAFGLLFGSVLVGGVGAAIRGVGLAAGAALVAIVLLFPWSLDLLLPGTQWSAVVGVAPHPAFAPRLGDLVLFDIGPLGSARFGVALLISASLALVIGQGWRFAWAVRLWVCALTCWGVAWAGGRGWLGGAAPAPDLLLAAAGAALSLAVAFGVEAFRTDLPAYRFGWRQVATTASALALLLAAVPVLGNAVDGRWNLPARDHHGALAWMRDRPDDGGYRVLWLGDPEVLPIRGWVQGDGLAYATSRDGLSDVSDLWPGPEPGTTARIDDALDEARAGRTSRLGQLLAPMAIRYVIVVNRRASAREVDDARPVPGSVDRTLRAQVDLRLLETDPALVVFENAQWAPARSILPEGAIAASERSGVGAARGADLAGSTPVLRERRGPTRYEGPLPDGVDVLLSESPSSRWRLDVGGADVRRRDAFGVANAFSVPRAGEASLRFVTSPWRYLSLAIQAALWVVAVRLAWRRRVRHTPLVEPEAAVLPPTDPTNDVSFEELYGDAFDDDLGDDVGDAAIDGRPTDDDDPGDASSELDDDTDDIDDAWADEWADDDAAASGDEGTADDDPVVER